MIKILTVLIAIIFFAGCEAFEFNSLDKKENSVTLSKTNNKDINKSKSLDENNSKNSTNNELNNTIKDENNTTSSNDAKLDKNGTKSKNSANSVKNSNNSESNNTTNKKDAKVDKNRTSKSVKKTNIINPNAPMLIFDDDSLTDNDIAQSFSAAMAMQSNGLINIKAVGLSGIDTNNKRSLLISSIAYYYGFEDIPIAISKRADVRKQWSPFSNHPPTIKSYKGLNRDLTEFSNDSILDNQRENVIIKYCEVLSQVPDGQKISIAVMGNSYNIESLLKEKSICNGYELIRNKVSRVVMVGGTDDNSWDMNFGAFGKFHKAAVASSRYVVFNTPVPIILVNEKAGCGLPGSAYKEYPKTDSNSPMSMVLSVKYGSHSKATDKIGCTQDASAILSAALNGKWYSWDLWDEVHGDLHVDSDGRVTFRRNSKSKNIKLFPKSYTNSIINQIFVELAQFKPQF